MANQRIQTLKVKKKSKTINQGKKKLIKKKTEQRKKKEKEQSRK